MPKGAATGRQYSRINVLILWGAATEPAFRRSELAYLSDVFGKSRQILEFKGGVARRRLPLFHSP